MMRFLRWALLCSACCVIQSASTPRAQAQATFWDWFQGRTPAYQPGAEYAQPVQPAGYTPVTMQPAAYPAPASAPCACGNNAAATPLASAPVAPAFGYSSAAPALGYSSAVGYAPTAGCSTCGTQPAVAAAPIAATYGYAPFSGCNTCGMASSVAATPTYVPTLRYRTTLARVPVTYYRPVMGADPGTGCAVTTLQPCTTYRWQFQRVPTTVNYRGTRSCWFWPWSNPDPPVAYAPAYAPACAPTISGAPAYEAAPSQTYTVPGAQSYTVPGTASPYYPAPGATLAPGPVTSPTPALPVPADNPPSLQPQAAPATGQGSAYRLPGDTNRSALESQATSVPLTPPAVGTEATRESGQGAVDPSTLHQPTFVKPVPDPDAPPLEAPQLLSPRDRTAARSQWDAVPISWPAPQPRLAPAPVSQPAPVHWDDSGWHTEQPR